MLTRARSLGRHRGKTPAQLRAALDTADCTLIGLATQVDELRAERAQLEDQLDKAAIKVSGALYDLQSMTADRDRLQVELIDARAELANATRVDVPPMERDTSAVEDQATGPIDVQTLWDAHGTGPVTDPGQVRQTRWGRDTDDTQPLPAA